MYSIKKISLQDGQHIWNTSPNANIFNNPEFLKNFSELDIFGVYKGAEIFCCWPILVNSQKDIQKFSSLFYYTGPYWSKKFVNLPKHSWLNYSLKVYEIFLEKFTEIFTKINFDLHYTMLDVRAFDWWNYHNKKERFQIAPRYSAIIEKLNIKSEDHIIKDFRHVRRHELKKFQMIKDQIFEVKPTTNEILDLYFETVNLEDKEEISKIKKTIKIINDLEKFNKVFAYKCKKNGKLISVSTLICDNNSSHLVLNLADEYWKKKGILTWAIYNSIMYTKSKNLSIYDFNGSNSPLRGDHKHSFGATTKLYFNLKYNYKKH